MIAFLSKDKENQADTLMLEERLLFFNNLRRRE
jgi:hypothetical protein